MNLTEKELFDHLIKIGYTYDPETGDCFDSEGKVLQSGINQIYFRFSKKVNGKVYRIRNHRFAFYFIHKQTPRMIDHIDRDTKNNSISNLRDGSGFVNSRNTERIIKAKGYWWAKHANMWIASIKINYKHKFLGYYKTEEEAHQAYKNALNKLVET